MKRPLAYYGNPVLRKKGSLIQEINEEIRQLVDDMFETMDAHNGVGLAAPQIKESLALFVTCIPRYLEDETTVPGQRRVFINPKIIEYSAESWGCSEGCLSIPGLQADVMRPLRITLQATDLDGHVFTEEFVGFDAHVIMHENDHINGVLYIDRLSPKQKKEIENKLREIKKKYEKQ